MDENNSLHGPIRKETKKIPRVLVITSCTKNKDISGTQQVQLEELWDGRSDDRTTRNFGALERYRKPAGKLYTGEQHLEVMRGVRLLREVLGKEIIDVKIISAGFGVVDEGQLLPPYNVTFTGVSETKIKSIAYSLGIPQAMNMLIQQDYDCAFFLLGESYLQSLDLPFTARPKFPCLFLMGRTPQKGMPGRFPYIPITLGADDASAFSCNLITLKGKLFRLFSEQIVAPVAQSLLSSFPMGSTPGERLAKFIKDPTTTLFLDVVKPFRKTVNSVKTDVPVQLPLFHSIVSGEIKKAKNYGRPMRYFIPDWDDLVDPGYNFKADQGTLGKRRYDDEVYSHQIYGEANYDGLLFSKSTIDKGKTKSALIKKSGGIHAFAKFVDKPVFGDCGAFSYIAEEEPPYQTQEILDYYQTMGFDYGVSIDHLIVPAFYAAKESRYELTRKNAREFIEYHRAGNYTFTPVGVAQGWSPETYKRAIVELLDLGYQYVALGGLARSPTKDIYAILKEIAPVLKEDTDLHLFGVARSREGDEMQKFREMGVTSFDSAAYLRRAWLGSDNNYYTETGQHYIALRIPPVNESSPWAKKLIVSGAVTMEHLKKTEQAALKALREYDRGKLDLEATLEFLLEVVRIEGQISERKIELYRKVLEDQPWKQCACKICREIGVEVLIFRGNDRNRRRGFHNTYVFYKQFRELTKYI